MSATEAPKKPRCENCATLVEVCSLCEHPDCKRVVCYRCLRVELGQSMEHPHRHGG